MHGSQKCCREIAELTVDDIWQIADASDQELQRLAHSIWRGTMKLGTKDNDCNPTLEERHSFCQMFVGVPVIL